jgi:threonine/homoserine/homoserine lactone efflux protein
MGNDAGQAICAASATQMIRRNAVVLSWLERVSGLVYLGLGLNLLRAKLQPT